MKINMAGQHFNYKRQVFENLKDRDSIKKQQTKITIHDKKKNKRMCVQITETSLYFLLLKIAGNLRIIFLLFLIFL